MILITDVLDRSRKATNFSYLTHEALLNGEETLSGALPYEEAYSTSYNVLAEQSVLKFEGQEYIVKETNEIGVGITKVKEFVAVRKIFDDLVNHYVYTKTTQSNSLGYFLNLILAGSGYTANVIGAFGNERLEEFGEDNALALFQSLLNTFEAEFTTTGKTITVRDRVGGNSNFRFQYKHNITGIKINIDTKNLSTYIKGYGKPAVDSKGKPTGEYVVVGEYTAPNASLYGILPATPYRNDKITNELTLLKYMKQQVQDSPLLSAQVDFIEFRDLGYPVPKPNLGDSCFIIYEPFDNMVFETRLTKVSRQLYLDADQTWKSYKTMVEFATVQKDVTDTLARFQQTSKAFERLLKGQATLPYSVLDEAVRLATEALNSAQTELTFDNGILAVDKTNANNIVVLNSAGLGISTNGGDTYDNAITALGINATVITTGQLNTNNVTVYGGNSGNFIQMSGAQFTSQTDPSVYTKINGARVESRGTHTRTWKGRTTTHDIRLFHRDGYFRARNENLNQSLYMSDWGLSSRIDGEGDDDASGTIEFHSDAYTPAGDTYKGLTIGSYGGRLALETDEARIYLNTGGPGVHISNLAGTYQKIYASDFVNSSERHLKRDIEDLTYDALEVVNQIRVREYKRLSVDGPTPYDEWQVGMILDEAPEPLAGATGVDLYSYVSFLARAIQQLDKKVTDQASTLSVKLGGL